MLFSFGSYVSSRFMYRLFAFVKLDQCEVQQDAMWNCPVTCVSMASIVHTWCVSKLSHATSAVETQDQKHGQGSFFYSVLLATLPLLASFPKTGTVLDAVSCHMWIGSSKQRSDSMTGRSVKEQDRRDKRPHFPVAAPRHFPPAQIHQE